MISFWYSSSIHSKQSAGTLRKTVLSCVPKKATNKTHFSWQNN